MVYLSEGPFMIRAHKIRLHPTSEQANYFARAAGTSRNARELGAVGMGSTVSGGRETDRVQTKARSSTRSGESSSPGPGK